MNWRAIALALGLLTAAAGAEEPDLSSPQAAAKSLYAAVQAEDGAGVESIFYADGEPQKQLVHAFAELLVAGRKLGTSAKARFGGPGEKMTQTMISREDLADIDAGVVKIDEKEDTATLTPGGQSRPMTFRRTDGKWRLIVTDYAHGTEAEIPRQVAQLKAMTEVMETAAQQITDGKYATAQEAESALRDRYSELMIAAARDDDAATRP
jgi:hypothetical protein